MDDNSRRWLLFMVIALALLAYFNLQTNKRQQALKTKAQVEQTTATATATAVAASPAATTSTLPAEAAASPAAQIPREKGEEIIVETKVYRVTFNTAGGFPTRWQIIDPKYARAAQSDVNEAEELKHPPLKIGQDLPVDLIPQYEGLDVAERDYAMAVVLKETGGKFYNNELNSRVYQSAQTTEPDGTIRIAFTSPFTSAGVRLIKTYRFAPQQYITEVSFELQNQSRAGAQNLDFAEPGRPGLGVVWGPGIGGVHASGQRGASSYDVAVNDGKEIQYNRFSSWAKASSSEPILQNFEGSLLWGTVESRFYMASLIPRGGPSPFIRGVVKSQNIPPAAATDKTISPPLTLEVYSGPFKLPPGQSKIFAFSLYAGPKKRTLLTEIDKKYFAGQNENLRGIMFHSSTWLIRELCVFMLRLMNWFYALTNNYGVAIILVVLVMRLITQPFTHIGMKHQARTMAEQKRIKPLIDAINEKHKNDPQKRNAEIWKTYKEHGVNPFGALKGCIWMLIQLPIFFALYRLLFEAIDLRGASFLWIHDLTAPDALFRLPFDLPFVGHYFNLLPILMGLSQLIAQRLQSSNIEDPTQKQMATIMPIMFIFILYNFPAGLSLYWFVSNLWQISFQFFVNKHVKEEAEKKAHAAFEQRQAAVQAGLPVKKSAASGPGWYSRFMARLEEKAKEVERQKKKK